MASTTWVALGACDDQAGQGDAGRVFEAENGGTDRLTRRASSARWPDSGPWRSHPAWPAPV